MSKANYTLDLHPIANNGRAIDAALTETFALAEAKRLKIVEIIPGKGSGQLMKRVQKWLSQKEQKTRYKRVEVDTKNHGRLFVHFR